MPFAAAPRTHRAMGGSPFNWREVSLASLVALLCACASTPSGTGAAVAAPAAGQGATVVGATTAPTPARTLDAPTDLAQSPRAAAAAADTDVKTRNALFKASSFAELPGWAQDDLDTAWDAFQTSCLALAKRDAWKPLCARAARLNQIGRAHV